MSASRGWLPWLETYRTVDDSRRSIRETRTKIAAGTSLPLAIVEHGRIIGMASLLAIDADEARCRCGYWLVPEREGRGIVTRAMASQLEHAFEQLRLREVVLRAAPGNVRSRAVAERLGFRYVGPINGSELYGERWGDLVEYVLSADEWRALRHSG